MFECHAAQQYDAGHVASERDRARVGDPRAQLLGARCHGGHLARIEAVNPRVNAIVTLRCRGRAGAGRRGRPDAPSGPLHGVPVAVKDLEDTAGMRTTYGSPLFADHVPDRRLAARLALAAGGRDRDRQDEHARVRRRLADVQRGLRHHAQPVRPAAHARRLERRRSGRGPLGMVPLADGSDLGASIRNPAAFCNLVGLRPSPGRVPDAGPGDAWSPFAVLGALAGSVADAALALRVLAGPDPRDPLATPARGSPTGAGHRSARQADRLEPDRRRPAGRAGDHGRAGLQRATLEAMGCVVEDVEPDLDGADEAFDVLRALNFAGAFANIIDRVKPDIAENARRGQALTADAIARALALRSDMFTRMRLLLERFDFLAAPVTQVPPFAVETTWPRMIAGVEMDDYTSGFARARGSRSRRTRPSRFPPASRRVGCPSGSSSSGATAASMRCSAWRRRSRRRRASGRERRSCDGLARRAAFAPRSGRRTRTRSRGRSGRSPADASPALEGTVEADLCIVGGGFTGLWAALHAKADDPAREVVLLEAERSASARAGATAASAWRRSRTGSPTAWRASPTSWTRSSGWGGRTSTGSSPTSRGWASTATSSSPAS